MVINPKNTHHIENKINMKYACRLGSGTYFNGLYLTSITLLQVLSKNMIVLLNKFGLFICIYTLHNVKNNKDLVHD